MRKYRRHEPGVIWGLRRENWSIYVRTLDEDTLMVVGPESMDADADIVGIRLSRKDAKLLAKRINECLKDTS